MGHPVFPNRRRLNMTLDMTLAYPTNADLIDLLKARNGAPATRVAACMHSLACMHWFA
jgi:hypothetical protein